MHPAFRRYPRLDGPGRDHARPDFRALLDRFYATATEMLIEHEAVVDKFVGDEVIGIFIPALAGGNHAGQAIDASLDLLRATGNGTDTPGRRLGSG